MVNGKLKSGEARTGADTRASFIVRKDFKAVWSNVIGSFLPLFFSSAFKGATIDEKCGINRLYHEHSPRNRFSSVVVVGAG
jgi:hypothetical protein